LLRLIERPVFVHDLTNPPAEDRNCDIELRVVNSKERIIFAKQNVSLQTKYLLKVPDAKSIGLTSFDQRDVEYGTKDVVLACNLSLQRACLSTLKADLPRPEIEIKVPETPVRIEHTPEGVHILLTETMVARDSVYLTILTKDELDEDQAIRNLRLVRKLDRHALSTSTPIPVVNLSKALSEFESAMTVFPRLLIFKHLFNSLEFSTNWDGTDRRGVLLDKEVANVSGIQEIIAGEWRHFYDRTKHVDRTPENATKFVGGLENLPQILTQLRKTSASMILDRLERL